MKSILHALTSIAAVVFINSTVIAQDDASPLKASRLRIKIFVPTGQANSLGTTPDKKEPDITPGKDALDAMIPFF